MRLLTHRLGDLDGFLVSPKGSESGIGFCCVIILSMKSIIKKEIQYLIALHASEESMLIEIVSGFSKWICSKDEVLKSLKELVENNTILVSKLNNGEFNDFNKIKTLATLDTWENLKKTNLILYLTESGEKRWKHDDWGISEKRKQYLFENS